MLYPVTWFFAMVEHKFNLDSMREIPETFGVYWIINEKTNQNYIGETYSLRSRLKEHYWALNANRHYNDLMQSDYNKNSSIFSYRYQIIEMESQDFLVQKDIQVEAESRAIYECIDLQIPLYNIHIPSGKIFIEYNNTYSLIHLTIEERDIFTVLRENPDLMNQVKILISSKKTKS